MKKRALLIAALSLSVLSGLYTAVSAQSTNRDATYQCVAEIGIDDDISAQCPSVSCLTQQGYEKCMASGGCTCDPMNDFCVPEPPPPPPPTGCPNVSCLSETGYYECIACPGCDCHPRTDNCVKKSSIDTETSVN